MPVWGVPPVYRPAQSLSSIPQSSCWSWVLIDYCYIYYYHPPSPSHHLGQLGSLWVDFLADFLRRLFSTFSSQLRPLSAPMSASKGTLSSQLVLCFQVVCHLFRNNPWREVESSLESGDEDRCMWTSWSSLQALSTLPSLCEERGLLCVLPWTSFTLDFYFPIWLFFYWSPSISFLLRHVQASSFDAFTVHGSSFNLSFLFQSECLSFQERVLNLLPTQYSILWNSSRVPSLSWANPRGPFHAHPPHFPTTAVTTDSG